MTTVSVCFCTGASGQRGKAFPKAGAFVHVHLFELKKMYYL